MERRENDENAGFRRIRLQELVFEEITSLLRDDVSDPEIDGVRVTAVIVSVDYRNARIHYTVRASCSAAEENAARALARATPFLRAQLAIAIDMKRVPGLRFVCDGEVAL